VGAGGIYCGFDSDDETIFARQLEFIERTAITWAMAGVLQAAATTALYDRMKREGRLNEASEATSIFSAPNFRTKLPAPVLLRGLSRLLSGLYEAGRFSSGHSGRCNLATRATQQAGQSAAVVQPAGAGGVDMAPGIRSNYLRRTGDFCG